MQRDLNHITNLLFLRIQRCEKKLRENPDDRRLIEKIDFLKMEIRRARKDPNYTPKIFKWKAGEHTRRPVLKIDPHTRKKEVLPSLKEAGQAIGSCKQNIWKAINQKRPHKGFIWKYA